jgi:hypothetical protein
LWLLLAAALAAGLWAIAQQLGWPVAVRAILGAVAALAVAVIPELRQRGARRDKSSLLLGHLISATPHDGMPRARDATLDDLRVHQSSSDVAYLPRDAEREVDANLRAGTPTLLVGHSMAGKTRLAVERVKAILPDARVLNPTSASVLRSLLDEGLIVKGAVVWLDDMDRFLKGDSGLDVPLIKKLVGGGAVLIGTIRVHEFEGFLPSDLDRPPQWDVIQCFKRVRLQRVLTRDERDRASHVITEPALLEAIGRYGLAEYLGAGPQAVERYENGETENPVGHALVHAAIDWRRAGLTRRVPRDDLVTSMPEYLVDRPNVRTDKVAIDGGFEWAVQRINETVALLDHVEHQDASTNVRKDFYEAFDYLVDHLAGANTPIPGGVLLQVVGEASLAESDDVSRVADRVFDPRPGVTAEIEQWLTSTTNDKVLVVSGSFGTGKSYLLAQIALMSSNQRQETSRRPRPAIPRFDLVTTARDKRSTDIASELAEALRLSLRAGRRNDLVEGIRRRGRPIFISIDGLDESTDPAELIDLLAKLSRIGTPDIHILVATRPHFAPSQWLTIDLDAHGIDRRSLTSFIMGRLLSGEHGDEFEADLNQAEEATSKIAEQSQGSPLLASILASIARPGQLGDALAQTPATLRETIDMTVVSLAEDYPLAPRILKLFAGDLDTLSEAEIVAVIQRDYSADPEYIHDTLQALNRSYLIKQYAAAGSFDYSVSHRLIKDYLSND